MCVNDIFISPPATCMQSVISGVLVLVQSLIVLVFIAEMLNMAVQFNCFNCCISQCNCTCVQVLVSNCFRVNISYYYVLTILGKLLNFMENSSSRSPRFFFQCQVPMYRITIWNLPHLTWSQTNLGLSKKLFKIYPFSVTIKLVHLWAKMHVMVETYLRILRMYMQQWTTAKSISTESHFIVVQ